jgi:steroid delta-isomerase-like uncharacterized protein
MEAALSEANKQLIEDLTAAFLKGEGVRQFFSDDFLDHDMMPDQPAGPAGQEAMSKLVLTAFPDAANPEFELVAEGDIVAARWIFTGTHEGEFMGVPASGRPVRIQGMEFFRVAEGKVAERWGTVDVMTMMVQVGALPG